MGNEAQDNIAYAKLSEARLVYWARLPGWRLREASALLLELDPDNPEVQDQSSFRDLKRVLLRAHSMKILHSPIKPRRLLEWAASNQIEIPSRLQSEVFSTKELVDWRRKALQRGRRIARLDRERPQIDINAKSKRTAERFFLCMALKHYLIKGKKRRINFKAMADDMIVDGKVCISVEALRNWITSAIDHQSEITADMPEIDDENQNADLQIPPSQAKPR